MAGSMLVSAVVVGAVFAGVARSPEVGPGVASGGCGVWWLAGVVSSVLVAVGVGGDGRGGVSGVVFWDVLVVGSDVEGVSEVVFWDVLIVGSGGLGGDVGR